MPSWIRSRNGQALVAVVLGDRDDEPQVGLDHLLLGGEVAALDPLGELDLFGRGQQPHLADVLEEQLQGVGRHVRLEIDRRLAATLAALAVVALGRDGLRRVDVLDQLDAGPLEVPVELLDIALVDVDLGDRGGDLAEGQHADLLALGQQVLYLFKFLKLSYKHSRSIAPFLLYLDLLGSRDSVSRLSGGWLRTLSRWRRTPDSSSPASIAVRIA